MIPANVRALQVVQATSTQIRDRIARVIEECDTPLGWAMRGVASWERDQLLALAQRYPIVPTRQEIFLLSRVEQQVFGDGA